MKRGAERTLKRYGGLTEDDRLNLRAISNGLGYREILGFPSALHGDTRLLFFFHSTWIISLNCRPILVAVLAVSRSWKCRDTAASPPLIGITAEAYIHPNHRTRIHLMPADCPFRRFGGASQPYIMIKISLITTCCLRNSSSETRPMR